jgi:hypothetical protein
VSHSPSKKESGVKVKAAQESKADANEKVSAFT